MTRFMYYALMRNNVSQELFGYLSYVLDDNERAQLIKELEARYQAEYPDQGTVKVYGLD